MPAEEAAERRAALAVRARPPDGERWSPQAARSGSTLPRIQDERLREKEFGILDRLTVAGIREKFP